MAHVDNTGGTALAEDDHLLLRKLHNHILPYLIAARRVTRTPVMLVSSFYSYIGDVGALLAGLGVGAPVIALLTKGVPEGKTAAEAVSAFLPGPWVPVGIAGLVLWGVIRLYVQREDVARRGLLAREFVLTMKSLNVQLYQALTGPDPMPKITQIHATIDAKVQEAVAARVWDWSPLPEDEPFNRQVASATASIRGRYMPNWDPAPSGERRP